MKHSYWFCLLSLLVLFSLFVPLISGQAAPAQQTDEAEDSARALLDTLRPEERVGQLFLVSFVGPEAGAGSQTGSKIYDLIVNYHVGGVILSTANDNFVGADQTLIVAYSLIDQLQRNEYISSQQDLTDPVTSETYRPVYIPLFVGISQEGDGSPYDQILSGLTILPSQMAQGATWEPSFAEQVGMVLGDELSRLGFNMLLGPSLDVLQNPDTGGVLDTRAYGGDPYWVGEMGKSFITGIHQGSQGQMAVVAKHFPGFGGADRLPEDEVATVRESLEQLKQVELAAFFAVTGNAPTDAATTDALLTSHIRYQGFQGNIRATTRPVSLDPNAFSQLMKLPEFTTWRDSGGLMVSDDLGSRAMRRFYDPTGETFNGNSIALEALLAGNDLLYLGNYAFGAEVDSYTNIIDTLTFFTQKYREDTVFAQRVDESVQRILTLKYRLYGNTFTLTGTLKDPAGLNQLGNSSQVSTDTARQSATLISPSVDELNDAFPSPPSRNEKIVFITDSRTYQQCTNCRQENIPKVTALADAVLRFYSATGQVLLSNLTSYSFIDLQDMLNAGTGVLQIENDLRQARWIVFAMQDVTAAVPSSYALRNFLDQRPDLYQQKNLIVFALSAPYYLDATDVSKLTAYYGLYSRSDKFIEVAARLLFKEIQPVGSLPVSVSAVGYDLYEATSPDPDIVIQVIEESASPEITSDQTQTPQVGPTPFFYRVGDTISVRVEPLVDHNGHIVPDNTIVRFILTYSGAVLPSQAVEAPTIQGIASATFRVDQSGTLTIRAESDPATQSTILTFDIPPENPTETPAFSTPEPTFTPTPTATSTETPTVTPTPVEEIPPPPRGTVIFSDWLVAFIVAGAIGGGNYWLANRKAGLRWGVRCGFLTLIGGLLFYSYLAVGLPGSESLIQSSGLNGVALATLAGAALGTAAGWIWYLLQTRQKRTAASTN
jgi:beta-N-acetylhexosaminidase